MKKFEKILRKHIEAVKEQTNIDVVTNTDDKTAPGRPCRIPNTEIIDVNAVCEAVDVLVRGLGNPGNNDCARFIKTNNTTPCSTKKYTKASTILFRCDSYADSVVAMLPQSSTEAQRNEVKRKAKCDCLNFAVFGRPSNMPSSIGFDGGVMKNQVQEFFADGCSYTWISSVCEEMRKVKKALIEQNPICQLPI